MCVCECVHVCVRVCVCVCVFVRTCALLTITASEERMVVAFFSLARILGESLTIDSPACAFFLSFFPEWADCAAVQA